jgi:hypothetical protein
VIAVLLLTTPSTATATTMTMTMTMTLLLLLLLLLLLVDASTLPHTTTGTDSDIEPAICSYSLEACATCPVCG